MTTLLLIIWQPIGLAIGWWLGERSSLSRDGGGKPGEACSGLVVYHDGDGDK